MQGDSADELVVRVDGVHGEADAVEVAADLDEPGHADGAGALDRVGDVERLVTLPRDVEVDVVVDDVDGQRVRQEYPAGRAAPTLRVMRSVPRRVRSGPRFGVPSSGREGSVWCGAPGVANRARSSSMTWSGSSLTKTPVGLAIGVPATTGRGPSAAYQGEHHQFEPMIMSVKGKQKTSSVSP